MGRRTFCPFQLCLAAVIGLGIMKACSAVALPLANRKGPRQIRNGPFLFALLALVVVVMAVSVAFVFLFRNLCHDCFRRQQ